MADITIQASTLGSVALSNYILLSPADTGTFSKAPLSAIKTAMGIDQVFTAAEKTKLTGIATAATANSSDAALRDRSTHTGVQAATTITQDSTHRFATDAEKATWNAAIGTPVNTAFGALTYASPIAWGYSAANPNKTITLTGNTTLSLTGTVNGDSGILVITQDNTGSRTLALPGTLGTGFTLATAANSIDLLTFTNVNGSIMWVGFHIGVAVSYQDLTYTFTTGSASNASGVWSNGSTPLASGYANKTLASGTNGRVIMKADAAGAYDNVTIGFSTTNNPTVGTAFDAAFNLYEGTIYRWDNGTSVAPIVPTVTVGHYYSVNRVGSVYTLEESTDKVNWTVLYTYTHSSTTAKYQTVLWNVGQATKLYYPQGINLT